MPANTTRTPTPTTSNNVDETYRNVVHKQRHLGKPIPKV
jgi:hypothetical protein